jgi:hypothetical protein
MDELKRKIEELYEFALNNRANSYQVVDLMEISADLAEKILLTTAVDVSGFTLSIDNYGILHTLERHGNPVREKARGQIAVTKADFTRLLDIINEFDSIRFDKRTHQNGVVKESFIFTKELENSYFVAKEIRHVTKKGKRNRLILQTMYIQKK